MLTGRVGWSGAGAVVASRRVAQRGSIGHLLAHWVGAQARYSTKANEWSPGTLSTAPVRTSS